KHFWFSKKKDNIMLNIDYATLKDIQKQDNNFFRRLVIITDNHSAKICDILLKYCNYGTKEEVGYNIFTKIVYGEFLDEQEVMNVSLTEDKK
ncbi:MAG: hypothetical protein NZZ41_01585, partial [Candidatus Dojkabacteria bacterium]|nr:hypothetical protein [Candidatus Dojkabacteria bacterium]